MKSGPLYLLRRHPADVSSALFTLHDGANDGGVSDLSTLEPIQVQRSECTSGDEDDRFYHGLLENILRAKKVIVL